MSTWQDKLKAFNKSNYTREDFVDHFQNPQDAKELQTFWAVNKRKPLAMFFQSSNDWQAFIPAVIQMQAATYGLVQELPQGLITEVPATTDNERMPFMWKNDGIEDYVEGEPFRETYVEGGTHVARFRKPGAKIVTTDEAQSSLPGVVMQKNLELVGNEFKVREWKHFMHELHKGTSNLFKPVATDKKGNPLFGTNEGWRTMFANVYEGTGTTADGLWADIKAGRHAMMNRERDAVKPTICILNASREAALSESDKINLAYVLGGSDTYMMKGSLPNVYSLQFIVVPDSLFGYFSNDVERKNSQFVTTEDMFLLANEGPTIIRYNREPVSTESWRQYDGQKNCLNIWERFNYGIYRFPNLLRIGYKTGSDSGLDLE